MQDGMPHPSWHYELEVELTVKAHFTNQKDNTVTVRRRVTQPTVNWMGGTLPPYIVLGAEDAIDDAIDFICNKGEV